jgi:antitoxin (DNA-binding transcriptional repressor) of toxin-antitoxin stability system
MSLMARIITAQQLSTGTDAALDEVEQGRPIIVTRSGIPIAEIRALHTRRFVSRAVIAEAAADAPHIDAGRWRADMDAVSNQSIDG